MTLTVQPLNQSATNFLFYKYCLTNMKGNLRRLFHRGIPLMRKKSDSKKSIYEECEKSQEPEKPQESEKRLPEKPKNTCPPPELPPPEPTPCLPPPPLQKTPGGILEMPHFLRIIGPKQIAVAVAYIPAFLRYGVVCLGALIYLSEWKTVLQYLPFYNGKYMLEEAPPQIMEGDDVDDHVDHDDHDDHDEHDNEEDIYEEDVETAEGVEKVESSDKC